MYVTNYKQRQQRVEKVREKYPAGTRVAVTYFNGACVKDGAGLATVKFVDDFGIIKVEKDDGTIIRIIPGIDTLRFLTDAEMSVEAERRISERERQK